MYPDFNAMGLLSVNLWFDLSCKVQLAGIAANFVLFYITIVCISGIISGRKNTYSLCDSGLGLLSSRHVLTYWFVMSLYLAYSDCMIIMMVQHWWWAELLWWIMLLREWSWEGGWHLMGRSQSLIVLIGSSYHNLMSWEWQNDVC